jgi:hypothetical protein
MGDHIIGDEQFALLCVVWPMFAGVGPSGSPRGDRPNPSRRQEHGPRFALIATRSRDARLACCSTRASRRAGPYESFLPNAGWSGLARPEPQGGAGPVA